MANVLIVRETPWRELVGRDEVSWLEYLARQGKSTKSNKNVTQRKGHQDHVAGSDRKARNNAGRDATPSDLSLDVLEDKFEKSGVE